MQLYADSVFYNITLHQADRNLPYLLMFHGFMGSREVFKPLIDDLAGFCNPMTIDLIGHGKTETPDNPELFHAERQVQQLKSVLDRLQFKPLYLFGYSMGGRVAFQLIARHPGLFAGAIIESSHCGISSKTDRMNRIEADKQRAIQIENNFTDFLQKWQQLPLFAHTPFESRQRYDEIMKTQKPELMSASLKGFGAGVMPNVCQKVYSSRLPLQLIAGSQDKKYAEIMEQISVNHTNAKLAVVKNAGHRVHTDSPEEWIRIVRDFIYSYFSLS
ncbi:MAG: 2-succinyl-6-hydroxy-2,4-cyclohexadiene-1-carboxylate synthase [Balneolaceae bacterium]|nr:2-succinyl-6-hydroxy-2,4-cyclohexadiene-1-carboxylate synthase [Balneolaceae bacterium]